MTEEKLNALRQQDTNLREAISQDEMERPQMPADLNARLMQRVANQKEKKPRRIVWPWIAAACVAGVMMIWLTPPKAGVGEVNETNVVAAKVVQSAAEPEPEVAKQPEVPTAQTTAKRMVAKAEPKKAEAPSVKPQEEVTAAEPLLAQETKPAEKKVDEKPVTLTERDIPITRPENYKYTPEELAQLKKQATEAYLKWVELEMEISRNNLQQTAQK